MIIQVIMASVLAFGVSHQPPHNEGDLITILSKSDKPKEIRVKFKAMFRGAWGQMTHRECEKAQVAGSGGLQAAVPSQRLGRIRLRPGGQSYVGPLTRADCGSEIAALRANTGEAERIDHGK